MYIDPNNNYPRHYGDIQIENAGWKLGDALPTGWQAVVETERPVAKAGYITLEDYPLEIDGVMTQNWKTRKLTPAEIERRDAPANAKAKLVELGLTDAEISALVAGLVR